MVGLRWRDTHSEDRKRSRAGAKDPGWGQLGWLTTVEASLRSCRTGLTTSFLHFSTHGCPSYSVGAQNNPQKVKELSKSVLGTPRPNPTSTGHHFLFLKYLRLGSAQAVGRSGPATHCPAMGDTFIRHIALLGFEKRFAPSQHYVSSPSALQKHTVETRLSSWCYPKATWTGEGYGVGEPGKNMGGPGKNMKQRKTREGYEGKETSWVWDFFYYY